MVALMRPDANERTDAMKIDRLTVFTCARITIETHPVDGYIILTLHDGFSSWRDMTISVWGDNKLPEIDVVEVTDSIDATPAQDVA